MGRFASDTGGSDFQQAPAGSHVARCIRLIDLGTQTSEYQGQVNHKSQVLVSWELCHELYDYEDENKQRVQKPFLVSAFYTNSLGEKANLRKDLISWRGRDFTKEELEKFDLQTILGAPCIVSVVLNDKGKAKVEGVLKLTKGTEAPNCVNKPYAFWLDEFNKDVFDNLSKGIKEIIEKSPEYQEIAKGKTKELADSFTKDNFEQKGQFDNFEDDIPFQMGRFSKFDNHIDYKTHPASPAAIKRDAFEAMDDEEKKFLMELSMTLSRIASEDIERAREYLDKQILDIEEYNALWWIVDSKLRALLKGKP